MLLYKKTLALASLIGCSMLAGAAQVPFSTQPAGQAEGLAGASTVTQAEALKQTVLAYVDVLDLLALKRQDIVYLNTTQQLRQNFEQMPTYEWEYLLTQGVSLSTLQQRLSTVRSALPADQLQISTGELIPAPDPGTSKQRVVDDGPQLNTIEFPEPETTVSICSVITSGESLGLLISWGTIREILAATRWSCVETVAGENAAESCTPANILVTAAEFEYKGADACLTEQRDAYLDTIFETEENIADHLSDFVDATTSGIASQTSLNAVQSTTTTILSDLSTLQSTLDDDDETIEDDLDTVLADLDNLTSDLVSLSADVNDIQLRVQENLVDIEDVETRAADALATAEEVRDDTQSIITALETLSATLDTVTTSAAAGLQQQQQAALVSALANPETTVIRYQLPAALGGELEASREIVIQAITSFGNVGAKTTTARQLLTQGDQAYNQQDYLAAYRLFARAYQSLTNTLRGDVK